MVQIKGWHQTWNPTGRAVTRIFKRGQISIYHTEVWCRTLNCIAHILLKICLFLHITTRGQYATATSSSEAADSIQLINQKGAHSRLLWVFYFVLTGLFKVSLRKPPKAHFYLDYNKLPGENMSINSNLLPLSSEVWGKNNIV